MIFRPSVFPYRIALVVLAVYAVGCGGHFSGPSGPQGISLSAPVTQLDAGAATQAAVQVTDFSGRPLASAPVTWESSDPTVLTIAPDATGHQARLTAGQKGGSVTVTVRAGSQSAAATLTVNPPKPVVPSFANDIQPIFTRSCALAGCHGPPDDEVQENQFLDAGRAYANTVNHRALEVRSGKIKRIDPGHPEDSYLVAKLQGTQAKLGGNGSMMPLTGTIPASDIARIVQWIQAGAPNN